MSKNSLADRLEELRCVPKGAQGPVPYTDDASAMPGDWFHVKGKHWVEAEEVDLIGDPIEISSFASFGELIRERLEASNLPARVNTLERRLNAVELLVQCQYQADDRHPSAVDPCDAFESVSSVRAFTDRIFSGASEVNVVCDAETGERLFVVIVNDTGSIDNLVEKSDLWHRGIHDTAGNLAHFYSLSVFPIDESA